MKRIIPTILLCILISGCGKSNDVVVEQTTTVTVEPEVTTEPEVDVEVEEPVEETVEVEEPVKTEEPVEESLYPDLHEEIQIDENGYVDGQPFPVVADEVNEQDKSDEFGIYSVSCYDIDEYLNEDGILEYGDGSDPAWREDNPYTGRWAYPVLTPCKYFTDLRLDYRSDVCNVYYCFERGTDIDIVVHVYSGLDNYQWVTQQRDNPSELFCPVKNKFTAETQDGQTLVLEEDYSEWFPDIYRGWHTYYFAVGKFSVSVQVNDNDGYTDEQVQEIIDNIRLTNGKER